MLRAVACCLLLLAAAPAGAGSGLEPVELPVQPDVLSQEMKDWLARTVPQKANELTQLQTLLRALQKDPEGPRLEYREGFTGTAREAFESGTVNCLSFSQIVVGMARELGIEAFYMDVRQFEEFTKEGDLVVVAGHMTAGFDQGIERRVLEFSVGPDVEYRNAVRISDATARAYFHSNRGAEHLQAGEVDRALEWFEAGAEVDPTLPDLWANLGVALRRKGEFARAEAAYRRAIELDPEFFPAYQNLVALYRMRGEPGAGELLLDLLNRKSSRNPFIYLAVGDLSMESGDPARALRFYQRGRRLRRSDPDFLAALGIAHFELGDQDKAARLLSKALARDPENPRAQSLRKKLDGANSPPEL